MVKVSAKFLVILLLCFSGTPCLLADEFGLPRFLPGDVVSSDYFNDIMNKLEDSKKTFSTNDLEGSWQCDAFGTSETKPKTSEWTADSNGLVYTQKSILTFTESTITTSTTNPFSQRGIQAINPAYSLLGDLLLFKMNLGLGIDDTIMVYQLHKTSPTRIRLIHLIGAVGFTHLICDKQALPPLPPSDLAATVSGKTVSLSWADNSTDETGFKIFRKETFDGAWSEIGSVGADTTSFEDTVTSDGKYWYRIFAVNDNGDSFGSNVIKVTIE